MVTLLGAVFIPLAIFCFLAQPFYLLPLLLISSLFEVASVFNGTIGNFIFGLSPFYFVELLIAIRLVLILRKNGSVLPPKNSPARPLAILLVWFWGWSVISSFVMPRLFSGISVYSPREGLDIELTALAPLTWSLSNLAQAGYLTLNVAVVFYAVLSVKGVTKSKVLSNALYLAVCIASIAAVIQIFAATLGLSYPYDIFNNNPAYAQGFEEDIGNYHRITSTFGEPSGAGSFLAAVAIGLLAQYFSQKHSLTCLLYFFVVSLLLLATTATTGYAEFCIASILLIAYWYLFRIKKEQRRSRSKVWLLVAGLVGVAGVIIHYNPLFLETMSAVTIEKSDSLSFLHRLTSDAYALLIVKDTWGLGVGLGSNRPSSLIPAFLSTLGILGTLLFVLIIYRVIRLYPGKKGPSYLQLSFWAFLTILIGGAIGVPDINRPTLWALFCVAVAQLSAYSTSYALALKDMQGYVRVPNVSLEGDTGITPAN
ncbi:MAG TPA: hypothetical protein VGH37_13720 [Candidatus Acidoferrum sp.]|jgi:hypothetical protein